MRSKPSACVRSHHAAANALEEATKHLIRAGEDQCAIRAAELAIAVLNGARARIQALIVAEGGGSSQDVAAPLAEKPRPGPNCAFCYGAWNGMDRWFMQDCTCKTRCCEPACKRGDRAEGQEAK